MKALGTGLVASALFAVALAACGPNGCAPTDNPTLGNLLFVGSPGGYTILSENTIPTAANDAWGNGVFGAPNQSPGGLGLSPANCQYCRTIQTSYEATPAPSRLLRQEVNVFARDPAEYANTIFSLVDDSSAWQAQTGPCALPSTITLKYPTLGGGSAGPAVHNPTVTEDFWGACQGQITPSLAGATGGGSIQAAIMNDHGLCAASVNVDSIFSTLQQSIWSSFGTGVAQAGSNCADAEQYWFYASEYIYENPNLAPDLVPGGGFDMDFSIDVPIKFSSAPSLVINYSYAWGLQDGILAVTPTAHGNYINDSDRAPALRVTMQNALQNTVASSLYQGAVSAQAVDIAAQAILPGQDDCTPTDSTGNPTALPVSANWIGLIIAGVEKAIKQAGTDGTLASLGIANADQPNQTTNTTPLQFLYNTIEETAPGDSSVYHNWMCANIATTTTTAASGSCTTTPGDKHWRIVYVPRARRLNYYPDSVEMVWSDDLDSEIGALASCQTVQTAAGGFKSSCTTTSAVPLFVILEDQYLTAYADGSAFGCGGPFNNLSQMCNGATASSGRSFSVFNSGHLYNTSSSTVDCVLGQIGSFILNLPDLTASLPGKIAYDLSMTF